MLTLTGDVLEKRVAGSLEPALLVRADEVVMRGDEPATLAPSDPSLTESSCTCAKIPGAAEDDSVMAMREAVRAAIGRNGRGSVVTVGSGVGTEQGRLMRVW